MRVCAVRATSVVGRNPIRTISAVSRMAIYAITMVG